MRIMPKQAVMKIEVSGGPDNRHSHTPAPPGRCRAAHKPVSSTFPATIQKLPEKLRERRARPGATPAGVGLPVNSPVHKLTCVTPGQVHKPVAPGLLGPLGFSKE